MASNVYKSINANDLKNRTAKQVSAAEKARIKTTLINFIAYLKLAHS
jgi:hypothetical protein